MRNMLRLEEVRNNNKTSEGKILKRLQIERAWKVICKIRKQGK